MGVGRVRIIGGLHSGRRLAALSGTGTRPTGDRVREALFNIWQSRVAGASLWDAYAGTGAVGLEAWSRGALSVLFSESSRDALKTLQYNIGLLGAGEATQVIAAPCETALARCLKLEKQFDLVFLDPPWMRGISEMVARKLVRLVQVGGMVVLESRQDQPVPELLGMAALWTRRYGDTRLTAFGVTQNQ